MRYEVLTRRAYFRPGTRIPSHIEAWVEVEAPNGRDAMSKAQVHVGALHLGQTVSIRNCRPLPQPSVARTPEPVWDAENYKPALEGERIAPEVAAFDANWGTGEAIAREIPPTNTPFLAKRKPGRPKKVAAPPQRPPEPDEEPTDPQMDAKIRAAIIAHGPQAEG